MLRLLKVILFSLLFSTLTFAAGIKSSSEVGRDMYIKGNLYLKSDKTTPETTIVQITRGNNKPAIRWSGKWQYTNNGVNWFDFSSGGGGGGGTPGGNNKSIQYNNNGVFTGDDNLTWDSGLSQLTIFGKVGIDTTSPQAKLHIRTSEGETTISPLLIQITHRAQPYYRDIVITNPTNGNLTDYQVKIVMDTQSLIQAGKMRSDCGDIRFYGSGGTLIPYYIWPGTANTTATEIWIKVPSIPANSLVTVGMGYGNLSLTSMANPDEVFLLFDDFTFVDTGKWIILGGENDLSVSNGILNILVNDSTPGIISSGIKSRMTFNGPITAVARVNRTGSALYDAYIAIGQNPNSYTAYNPAPNLSIMYGQSGGSYYIFYDGYETARGTGTLEGIGSGWSIFQIKWLSNTNAKFYINDVLKANLNGDSYVPNLDLNLRIGIGGTSTSAHTLQVDWVYARKITSSDQEPSVSIGEEQQTLSGYFYRPVIYVEPDTGRVAINSYDTNNVTLRVNGIVSAFSYLSTSDAILKTNISPLKILNAKDKIMQIQPKQFEWRDKSISSRTQIGIIADEVKDVFPEIVVESPSGEKSIDLMGLITMLIKVIQEQNNKIQYLENTIENLKTIK